MKNFIFGALLAGLALVFLIPAALADDSFMGGEGESLRPRDSQDIAMNEEHVSIYVYPGFYEVAVDYVFKNTGPEQTVIMGFPMTAGGHTKRDETALNNFRAWVNGSEVETEVAKENEVETVEDYPEFNEYDVWYTHSVPFKAGEEVEVRNSYWAEIGASVMGDRFFKYVLNTGKTWADDIGLARVDLYLQGGITLDNFDNAILPDEEAYSYMDLYLKPTNYKVLTPQHAVWTFTDFEPSEQYDIDGRFYMMELDPARAVNLDEIQPACFLGTVTASDSATVDQHVFEPEWVCNGGLGTAWGVNKPGVGEWVKIDFGQEKTFKEFAVFSVPPESTLYMQDHDSPAKLKLTFDDGSAQVVTLDPSLAENQYFKLQPVATQTATVEILESGSGSEDVVGISELSFNEEVTRATTEAEEYTDLTNANTETEQPLTWWQSIVDFFRKLFTWSW